MTTKKKIYIYFNTGWFIFIGQVATGALWIEIGAEQNLLFALVQKLPHVAAWTPNINHPVFEWMEKEIT